MLLLLLNSYVYGPGRAGRLKGTIRLKPRLEAEIAFVARLAGSVSVKGG